ncbi:MAG: diguanylate cyclase, partial [Acidimicrobiia bacterium]|nr:diguanylate cyclase [Acidimicrobiia bacterium]
QGSVVGVAGVVDKHELYTEVDRRRLPILFHSLWTILHHSRMERVLEGLRAEDPVTRLPNRGRFEQLARIEMRRADRAGSPLSIVICDLDHFAAYNAVEGSAAGDRVLRMVADVLGDAFQRAGDLIARLDDDAFAMLLPATEQDAFPNIGERARAAIEDLRLPHPSSDVTDHVTASVGSALHLPRSGSTVRGLLAEAWEGVEVARSAGGNLAGRSLPEA